MNRPDVLWQMLSRDLGVSSIENDHAWGFLQEPYAYRMVPNSLNLGQHERAFYPFLFRWKMRDGRRFAVKLEPPIVGEGRRSRQDDQWIIGQLIQAIRSCDGADAESQGDPNG